jgi:TonB-linked SusC/RagA family outer membrane protein
MYNFTYLLRKRRCLLVFLFFIFFSFSAVSQSSKNITGIVKGKSDGQSLPGVSIKLKGTSIGALTDLDGVFNLSVPPTGGTLVVSYLGFKNLEVPLDTKDNYLISLEVNTSTLDEVIVIGYGSTSRQNITTSVAKIDPTKVPQAANSNVLQLLAGRASGLRVTQASSQPGGAINLSIRGRGRPLYVVDGVLYAGDGLEPGNGSIANETNNVNRSGLAGLNPADIESIEVLKDASAAIYGVNAANGVVLITTKNGKAGKLQVSYNGNHSVSQNVNALKPLNATQYQTLFNNFASDYTIGTKPTLFTDAQIAAAGEGTDWLGEVLQLGQVDNHVLTVNGGGEKVKYYFSGGYYNEKGTVKASGLKKYTGRANLSFDLAKWVTLRTNFTGVRNSFLNTSAGGQNGGAGTQGFGLLQAAIGYPATLPFRNPTTGNLSQFGLIANPISLLDISDQTFGNSLGTNLSADFKIIPNVLTGRLLYGNTFETAKREFFVPSTVYYYTTFQARGSINYSDRNNETMEATLTYKDAFLDQKLTVDVVAGLGQYQNRFSAFGSQGASAAGGADAIGITNLSLNNLNMGITSTKFEDKTRSYFITSSVSFLDKYLATASLRYDGYSLFFPESKYAAFPSVSLGWKINKESFLENVKSIQLLKIRGSYGTTGSTIGAAAYGGYAPDGNFLFFNNGAASYVTIARYAIDNPNLTWQKTINKNIGLDFELFNSRISGSVDFFQDDITNLLQSNGATAPLFYLSTQPINGGHQVRSGYDINLNTNNIRSKKLSWSSVFNISHYNFKWKERFPNYNLLAFGGVTYQDIDAPVNEIYYFKSLGILQPGQVIPASQPRIGGANLAGAPIIADINGDNKLTGADVLKTNFDPKLILGFGNNFKYKQLNLGIMLYGQLGGNSFNNSYNFADPIALIAGVQNVTTQALDIYSTANPMGTQPGVNYNQGATGLPHQTDIRLEKTDFIRCRNITLGYDFSPQLVNKVAKSLNLFIDLQNAFTITNFTGIDPEAFYSQFSKGGFTPYPTVRTISFGVKAEF